LPDQAGAEHQLVADDLRVRWAFLQDRQKSAGKSQDSILEKWLFTVAALRPSPVQRNPTLRHPTL
jgi:hypothetical protein